MQIFTEDKGVLKEVFQQPFVLEAHVQRLVENNMKALFNIDFVASEFMVKGLRVDSLGYDEESNSFVIIEYKRDKYSSVFDQGVAYLALMLNNKADFKAKYEEKTTKPLKKEIDWTQSRVILMAPFFTMHQRMATGFKDLAIELWEIKKYSNNTYLFNKIESEYKDESITKISKSKDSESVSKGIVVYSEDSHLAKCDERTKGVYNELRDKILSISPSISVKVNKVYIAFVNKRNFVSVFTKRSRLELHLGLKKGELNDPRHLTRDLSKNPYQPSTTQYAVSVDGKSDLGYILSLIIQAYDKTNLK